MNRGDRILPKKTITEEHKTVLHLDGEAVQALAADRIDHLTLVLAIGQELQRRLFIVHHAARHRDHLRRDVARHAGMFERDHAARRQREID